MFVPELRDGSTPQKNKISPHGYAPPPDPFPPAGTEVPPLSETFSPYFATESRPFPRPSRRMDRPAPRARFSRRFPGPVLPAPRIAPPPSARFPASPPPPAVTSPCAPPAPLRAVHPRNGAHERLVLQHMVASGRAPAQRRREVEFVIFASRLRTVRPRGGAGPASKWPSVILRAARPRGGACRRMGQRLGAEPRHAPVQREGAS